MKTWNYLWSLLLLIGALTSCSEEKIELYDGKVSGIYLQRNYVSTQDGYGNILTQTYIDSITYTFASYKPTVTELKTSLPVKIMGKMVDYDRPFTLKVDEENSTAVRGVHFDFNEVDCVIKGGTVATSVPVILYRQSELKDHNVRAVFMLESNEHFTSELEEYKNTNSWQDNGYMLCGSRYKIIFSDIMTEPGAWTRIGANNVLGDWSINKEMKVNELMGWSHMDWLVFPSVPTAGRMPFVAKLMRKTLQAAADAGSPILDDDGSYMQLVPPYEVDYSAYE